jgi:hypothetical protein
VPTQVIAKNYVIGPGEIYYRDVGVNTDWTNLGATLDAITMRIISEWFIPDNLTGVKMPVQGLDVLRRLNAEFEFTLPDFVGGNMEFVMPGARTTAEVHSDTATTPLNTDLDGATAAGDRTITLTAVTNAAVGDYVRIGSGAGQLVEYRQITSIDTNDITFRDPLLVAHADAEAVVETDGDYRTKFEASLYSRMPDTAYKEWSMVSGNGVGYHEIRLPRGLAHSETAEISVDDNSLSGMTVMVQGRGDGNDLTTSPFEIYAPAN